jgi:hypothetical protein
MSLLTETNANYAGFGSVTAKFGTVEKVQAEDVETDTLTATGDIVTTGDVTCNTLNWQAFNPQPPAYTTVATQATLVTQTIPNQLFVWCADKATLFRGLQNPQDTTILPTGTPWPVRGVLQASYRVFQNSTNAPFILVVKNELFVGTTVNVIPTTFVRTGAGQYELQWSSILPYDGIVSSVVIPISITQNAAQVGVGYARSGPPYSLISIVSRDYAGNFVDFAPGSPNSITITIDFVPRSVL